MRRSLAMLGLLAALGSAPAPAEAGNFYLGLGLQGSSALDESDIEGDGGGAELTAGYFFTPRWALEISGLISDFENDLVRDGWFGGFSVNARFSPFPHERFQPFAKLGVGGYLLEDEDADAGLTGPGLNLGVGFEFFLVPGLAVGADATWRFIEYTHEYYDDGWSDPDYYELYDEIDGTTLSAGVTLSYHFR